MKIKYCYEPVRYLPHRKDWLIQIGATSNGYDPELHAFKPMVYLRGVVK